MKIVDIRERSVPLHSTMRNAFIDFSKMTASVCAIITDVVRDGKPVIGYGIGSNGRYAQGGILRERLIPRVLEAEPDDLLDSERDNFDPAKVLDCMMRNEKPGGHGDRAVAAAVVDMAMWDIVAKIEEKPLWRVIADRFNGGASDERVLVYPGGGYYYPGQGLPPLQAEMRKYQEQGYRVLKMKVGGADLDTDLRRIEAVLEIVGEGANLAVDANGRFSLDEAIAFGKAVEPYKLFWFEEPGDPLDYALNAELTQHYSGPIATGENLFSVQDAKNLVTYGGMRRDLDWIQIDPALAYGFSEYLKVDAMMTENGWNRRQQIPHGGHQLGFNMAAGMQLGGSESYPLVFQPWGGFADDVDIVDGYARPHATPGIGIELKSEVYRQLKALSDD
ncbi:MAG: mandelate racemase [Rhodospirillaceae bacterium]|jgi:D(-)-tartrate dehydratase|nr:mandelate racemase [Rhodospirillaceae bacterium]